MANGMSASSREQIWKVVDNKTAQKVSHNLMDVASVAQRTPERRKWTTRLELVELEKQQQWAHF
jgi:hypothetical protein